MAESRDEKEAERVLLPKKQVPEGAETGDELEVFIYRDSSDRPIATVKEPTAQLGKTAVLTVSDVGKIGAFLDWGLKRTCCFRSVSRRRRFVRERKCWLLSISIKAAGCVPP